MAASTDTQQLRRRLRDEYERIGDVHIVSDGTERVFRVQAEGRTVFVREVSEERQPSVRRALSVEADIGIPETKLLDGEPPLLVMEAAAGRPLSVLLPLFFLPIAWRLRRQPLRAGARELGAAVGRLHTATTQSRTVAGDCDAFADRYLSVSDELTDYFNDETKTAIETAISRVANTEWPVCCIFSDPTPHNIFYADGELTLIDYTFYDSPAVKDLVTFERGVELMARRLPYARQSQALAVREAFQAGYDRTGPAVDIGRPLRLLDYCYVLDSYLEGKIGGRNAGITSRLTRQTDVWHLQRKIRRLTTEFERSSTTT